VLSPTEFWWKVKRNISASSKAIFLRFYEDFGFWKQWKLWKLNWAFRLLTAIRMLYSRYRGEKWDYEPRGREGPVRLSLLNWFVDCNFSFCLLLIWGDNVMKELTFYIKFWRFCLQDVSHHWWWWWPRVWTSTRESRLYSKISWNSFQIVWRAVFGSGHEIFVKL